MAPLKEMVKNNMDRNLYSIGSGYRLCILGDLNGWVGDGTIAGITGAFEVPEENDNGRRVVDSVWVIHILSTEVCISTQEWQGSRRCGD